MTGPDYGMEFEVPLSPTDEFRGRQEGVPVPEDYILEVLR